MKIDANTPIWVVNDPLGPHSTLPDVCFETDLAGLRLQFAGGLSMDQRPALFTTQEEAHEEALNRLLVCYAEIGTMRRGLAQRHP